MPILDHEPTVTHICLKPGADNHLHQPLLGQCTLTNLGPQGTLTHVHLGLRGDTVPVYLRPGGDTVPVHLKPGGDSAPRPPWTGG